MRKKTNKVIYVYQVINFPKSYTPKELKKRFNSKRFKSNCFYPNKIDYGICLEFISHESDGGLFFKIVKIRNQAQKFYNFARLKAFLYGDKNKIKPLQESYFVYYPSRNIILSLYNNDALMHITAPLQRYFNDYLHKENTRFKLIDSPITLKEAFNGVPFINKVTIKTSIRNISHSSEAEELNPFETLEDYSNTGTKTLTYPYLKKYKRKAVELAKALGEKFPNAYEIHVSGKNIDDNILGKIFLNFPCDIEEDNKGLTDFDDFKNSAQKIFEENKDTKLEGY